MGESRRHFSPKFNKSVKLEVREERMTSEAGAMVLREMDESLEMSRWLGEHLEDPRDPSRIKHPLVELVRSQVYLLAQGWRDQDDADVLRQDAALRLAVSERKSTRPLQVEAGQPEGLASQPTLSRLSGILASEHNRARLREALVMGTCRRLRMQAQGKQVPEVTVDLDGLPVEVHGEQPGSAYNGHYQTRIYHPLVASIGETGDLLGVWLREGQVHSASGALEALPWLLEQVERNGCRVRQVRFDAAFPEEKLLKRLEERGTHYVARVRNTQVLKLEAAIPRLLRSGRPAGEPCTYFEEREYQSQGWSRPRRVVLVLQEKKGELFPNAFWLVTSWSAEEMPAEELLRHYRQRGTAEGHFGEWMDVLAPALSSSPRPKSQYRGQEPKERSVPVDAFAQNEVRLLLSALAYNLAHAARALLQQDTGDGWGLRRFRERVLRVAARILVHGRRALLVVGRESANLWNRMWRQLEKLSAVRAT